MLSGEPLKYGAVTINGIVNRKVTKVRDGVAAKDGKLDFSLMGMSEIEFVIGSSIPTAGETFYDSVGIRHRVEYVTQTDITFVLYCKQSRVS